MGHMTMTATATSLGGLAYEVDVNGRHTIVTDEPERLGGGDLGPAPHELLAATLASCVATTVAMYANARSWEIGETSVRVEYDPDCEPRRFTVRLDVGCRLSAHQRLRLERVAASCPVRRALEAGFEFDEQTLAPAASRAA